MRYLNKHSRIIKAGTAVKASNPPTRILTYSESFTRTRSFGIVSVSNFRTIQLDTADSQLFVPNQTVRIEGSTAGEGAGINDGLYFVETVSLVNDSTQTEIRFFFANLADGLSENGQLHIARDVRIQHNLSTANLIYRVHKVESGESVTLPDDSMDNNALILRSPFPETPETGIFHIAVIGF